MTTDCNFADALPLAAVLLRSTARHWMKRARGLLIGSPVETRYGADHSLQVASGLSVLPLRVCNSTLPAPRQVTTPHWPANLVSRTGEVYIPSLTLSRPIRYRRPRLLDVAYN